MSNKKKTIKSRNSSKGSGPSHDADVSSQFASSAAQWSVIDSQRQDEEELLMQRGVPEVQRLLGYRFRNPALLEDALTHSSYPNRRHYDRLEFVGDAAINLVFGVFFYATEPNLNSGGLSSLRSANISTEKLARVAVHHGLYRFLRHNCSDLRKHVTDFVQAILQQPEEDFVGAVSYGGCVAKAPKVLPDIVEAIVAAVFFDCQLDFPTFWVVIRGFLEPIVTVENHDPQPVTMLYEICQGHGWAVKFKSWKNEQHLTIVNVFVDGELIAQDANEHKDIAKLNAARRALQELQSKNIDLNKSKTYTVAKKSETKKQLNELCMKRRWPKPVYQIVSEDGPAHSRKFIFSVQVEVPGKSITTLSDRKSRVRDAENEAASVMLLQIENLGY